MSNTRSQHSLFIVLLFFFIVIPTESITAQGPDVELEAFRSHQSEENYDATVSIFVAKTYSLPARLEVIEGNSGTHWAMLSYKGSDGIVDCLYSGNGQTPHTPPLCQEDNGDSYEFAYCGHSDKLTQHQCQQKPNKEECWLLALAITPDDAFVTTGFKLTLQGRDTCGDTRVRAYIPAL